jgi:hypothetical protein
MAPTTAPDPTTQQVLVGRFSRYRDLKRAVDSLRVARIPDRRITVLGRGLEWSPPLTAERAARIGGWLGAMIGSGCLLLLALAGAVAADLSWLGATLAGGLLGGLLGIVLGVAFWRICRDNAMLPESGHVEVDRYDLLVNRDDLAKARDLLGD